MTDGACDGSAGADPDWIGGGNSEQCEAMRDPYAAVEHWLATVILLGEPSGTMRAPDAARGWPRGGRRHPPAA